MIGRSRACRETDPGRRTYADRTERRIVTGHEETTAFSASSGTRSTFAVAGHAECGLRGRRRPHIYMRYGCRGSTAGALRAPGRSAWAPQSDRPLKVTVLPLLDAIIPRRTHRRGQRADFHRRRSASLGDNTDGRGFLRALGRRGRVRGPHALLIGGAVSARAVASALAGAAADRSLSPTGRARARAAGGAHRRDGAIATGNGAAAHAVERRRARRRRSGRQRDPRSDSPGLVSRSATRPRLVVVSSSPSYTERAPRRFFGAHVQDVLPSMAATCSFTRARSHFERWTGQRPARGDGPPRAAWRRTGID